MSADASRFEFGRNWQRLIARIDEPRIASAAQSLRDLLGVETLAGKRFLDIGSGSGLFSLAARRLGAKVYAFDFDPQSVACTNALRDRFLPSDGDWIIEQGSILDANFTNRLGAFDVVYAWGVLHHTGDLWAALDRAIRLLAPGGRLAVAIYNDQGLISRYWAAVKRLYAAKPPLRPLIIAFHAPYLLGARWLVRQLRNAGPDRRGMDLTVDMIDWLGGWPFAVAKPEAVIRFALERRLKLEKSETVGRRHGCNEFIFSRGPN